MPNNLEEKWAPVPGYEGLYDVSTLGRVRSYRWSVNKPRLMKPALLNRGYLIVRLSGKGKPWQILCHRLVAMTFIGDIGAGMEVNHMNGVKTDNRITNLEIVTRSENLKHAFRVIKTASHVGERNPAAKLNEGDVKEIRRLSGSGLSNRAIARMFGVSNVSVGNIMNGKTWAAA